MKISIKSIDHLVLTVKDISRTCDFYRKNLGMEVVDFGSDRKALVFGDQKINLHKQGCEISPHALVAKPGTADICLISETPIAQLKNILAEKGINVIEGPVERTGAAGPITSIYFRDPDGNLLEISNY